MRPAPARARCRSRKAGQQIGESGYAQILYAEGDQRFIVCQQKHQQTRAEDASRKKQDVDQQAQAQTQRKQIVERGQIALAPVLRAENGDAGGDSHENDVLYKLDLRGKRDCRHRILRGAAEHERVRRRNCGKHQILKAIGAASVHRPRRKNRSRSMERSIRFLPLLVLSDLYRITV